METGHDRYILYSALSYVKSIASSVMCVRVYTKPFA